MMKLCRLFVLPSLLLLLAACGPSIETGPEEVRWDRQTCTRCVMSVSDQRFAAQVREAGEDHRVHFFDDIGCAITWLEQQEWKEQDGVEIWVADFNTHAWLDARNAWFTENGPSPMGFNLAARAEQQEGAVKFENAVEQIKQHKGHSMMNNHKRHH